MPFGQRIETMTDRRRKWRFPANHLLMRKRKNCKGRTLLRCTAAAFIALCLLTSCSDSRQAEQEKRKADGIALLQAGSYAEASSAFRKALGKSRYRVGAVERDLVFYLATAEYLNGEKADALASLDALTGLDENDAEAYYLRGSLYLLEGETEKGLADYDTAVAAAPEDYECYIAIYNNLSALGQAEKANEYINKALGVGNNSARDYLYRGKIYELTGQREAAESAYKKASAKGENIAALYSALLTAEDGRADEALGGVSAYTKEHKELSAEENLLLAKIYGAAGQYDAALSSVEAGLSGAASGEKQALLKEKIILCEKKTDFNAAYAAANDYISAYPGDAAVLRELTFLATRKQ